MVLLLAPILLIPAAHAKVFRNAYIAFEMPESWKCNLEVTEWVCRADQGNEAKEAIIILTAKEVGPTDSYPLYENHLNKPVPLQSKSGVVDSNIVYKAKTVNINDQTWVDGLHLGSEVPNYFTRYLATIKQKIAILVTLSAHKNYYTRYSQEFFKTVMSLKVVASNNILSKPDLAPIRPGSETLGPGMVSGAMPGDMGDFDPMMDGGGGGAGGKNSLVLVALALAAVGLILFLRKRRKK